MSDWRTESRFSHQVEQERRLNGIKYLFEAWGLEPIHEKSRIRIYFVETQRIPFYWFRLAVRRVIASNRWPKLPRVADISDAAENLAGMDRERYHAGQYLPRETEWPDDGQRYAINLGEFEQANSAQLTTGPRDARPALPAGDAPSSRRDAQSSRGSATEEIDLF